MINDQNLSMKASVFHESESKAELVLYAWL